MFLNNLYGFIKPVVSKNKFFKKLVVKYSQICSLLPKVLTIALTYRCPCNCVHCGISDYRKKNKKELSAEEVKRLIDEAKRIRSIVQITFTGGEPLLRKDIFELVEYSKKSGFFTKIDTNAAFLDKEKLVRLKDAGLGRIGISLDHYKEDLHDKLRNYEGLFKKVIMAVSFCHELNISCYLQTYTTRQRMENGDLEKILDLAEKLNVDKIKVQTPAILGSLRNKNEVILRHEDFLALAEIISQHKSAYVESEVFSPLDYKKFCSLNFRANIHITSYGDVLPCCWLPLSFGNVRDNSLSEILRYMYKSQAFKRLLACEGCLCSDKKFLNKYIGDTRDLPVKINACNL